MIWTRVAIEDIAWGGDDYVAHAALLETGGVPEVNIMA